MELRPREKAQQLIDEFNHEIEFNCQPSIVGFVAKKCAIVAAKQLASESEYFQDAGVNSNEEYWGFQSRLQFYEQVKQEIEKL